jgi:outer membrane protein assembly factor BamB
MTKVFFAIVIIIGCGSCHSHLSPGNIAIADSVALPGIPSEKTLYFKSDVVYYESMDEPDIQTIKCFSLKQKKLIWSKKITGIGINEGVISSENEYVVPTLSDTVYLFNSAGNERILNLEYRCKINPLAYKNTFILQDRGVGLKCFDSKTLKNLWLIKQRGSFSMSQPMLLDSSLIYVLDDNSIEAANAANGALKWKIPVKDTLGLYFLYGQHNNIVFTLCIDSTDRNSVSAIDYVQGKTLWDSPVDTTVDTWEWSMSVRGDTIFLKGSNELFMLDLTNGKQLGTFKTPFRITTNLVTDIKGNLVFGLENNMLMKIDPGGKVTLSRPFAQKINRLYKIGDKIFVYNYPYLSLLAK